MATLGNKLLIKQQQWTANMTDSNQLGYLLMQHPHLASKTMDKIFAAENIYSDNLLTSGLLGRVEIVENHPALEWEWEMKGADSRPLIVIENVLPVGMTKPGSAGQNNGLFKLKLEENWYKPTDVLTPGSANTKYQARVVSGPVHDGDGYIYTMKMNVEDPQAFIPLQYFKPGTTWGKFFSTTGEGSKRGGSTQFSGTMAFRSQMSHYRKEYAITDYASTAVLAAAIPDSSGTLRPTWVRYAEVEFFKQWQKEKEVGAWFNRKSRTVIDPDTGRPVTSGPGIEEYLEDSHIQHYNHLTMRMFEEYLMDIYYSRKKPGERPTVVGLTGDYGLKNVHEAGSEWMKENGIVKNIEFLSANDNASYTNVGVSVGFQITKLNLINGISVEFMHNTLNDDRTLFSAIDPLTGYPERSQRITFLDLAGDGGANVKIVKKKGGFAFGYYEGLYGPLGPNKSGKISHPGAWYEMHINDVFGVQISDVTKCGELIPNSSLI